jgi:hypothetical protein
MELEESMAAVPATVGKDGDEARQKFPQAAPAGTVSVIGLAHGTEHRFPTNN